MYSLSPELLTRNGVLTNAPKRNAEFGAAVLAQCGVRARRCPMSPSINLASSKRCRQCDSGHDLARGQITGDLNDWRPDRCSCPEPPDPSRACCRARVGTWGEPNGTRGPACLTPAETCWCGGSHRSAYGGVPHQRALANASAKMQLDRKI